MTAVRVESAKTAQSFIERHLLRVRMKIRRMTPSAYDELMALSSEIIFI